MRFIALDVETANADYSSICQIGIAIFRNGQLEAKMCKLVDPCCEFEGRNIGIHGIRPSMVAGQPKWPVVIQAIRGILEGQVVASHTPFDREAVGQACTRYGIVAPDCNWLNTAQVARRAWPDRFGQSGYGLASVSEWLGIDFGHHDAGEDARAAGEILCRAIEHTGLPLDRWFKRLEGPIVKKSAKTKSIAQAGVFGAPLHGHVLVFTGSLMLQRSLAAELASRAGCDVAANVTSKTTLLVVGDQDLSVLGGKDKSTKHLKAEKLIEGGHSLRIIRETEFLRLVGAQPVG